jgi:hypothetical protein
MYRHTVVPSDVYGVLKGLLLARAYFVSSNVRSSEHYEDRGRPFGKSE